MAAPSATMASQFTPPRLDEEQLQFTVSMLNEQLRALHARGRVVIVAEVHECTKNSAVALPQIRVDVRPSLEAATSRPEVLDA